MRKTHEVLNFAAKDPTLFVMFEDYWKHYMDMEQRNDSGLKNKKSFEYDNSKTFDEKESKLNAALISHIVKQSGVPGMDETNIGKFFNHPSVIYTSFAVVGAMIDYVIPDTIIDSIGMFTDLRQGGFGENFSFDVAARDAFIVSKAGHGQQRTEVHKQFKGQVTVTPENREITVGVSLYKVLTGTQSLAEFVIKAVRGMETQMTLDAYNAFATAMAAVDSTATTGLLVAGYTAAGLIRLAEQVSVWNNSKACIFGTTLALQSVLPDDANYRYTLEDPYVKMGYIQQLAGYDVIRLAQVADLTTPFGRVLSDSALWVVSPGAQKIVKLCLEGETQSTTTGPYDLANLSMQTTLTKAWAAKVVTNSVGGEVTLP